MIGLILNILWIVIVIIIVIWLIRFVASKALLHNHDSEQELKHIVRNDPSLMKEKISEDKANEKLNSGLAAEDETSSSSEEDDKSNLVPSNPPMLKEARVLGGIK